MTYTNQITNEINVSKSTSIFARKEKPTASKAVPFNAVTNQFETKTSYLTFYSSVNNLSFNFNRDHVEHSNFNLN